MKSDTEMFLLLQYIYAQFLFLFYLHKGGCVNIQDSEKFMFLTCSTTWA